MECKFELKIGNNTFTITETVATHSEFFQKMSFYSGLPKSAPNGSQDLVLQFRRTKDNHEYYSIVCKEEGVEFKLGQYKQEQGALFPKGWEPIYNANSTGQAVSSPVIDPLGGFTPPQQAAPTPTPQATTAHTPVQQATPAQAAPSTAIADIMNKVRNQGN